MLTQVSYACTDIIFCHFRSFFVFLPHYWPQKLRFGKNVKKTPDILSFYTCIPLIKIIWSLVLEIRSSTDRNFLSSRAIFCPFAPLTPWKMKISKIKKNMEIWTFYASVPKIMIICYTVPEVWRITDVIVTFISGSQVFF